MKDQSVFKRYEFKYLLNKEQKERVLQAIEPHSMAFIELKKSMILWCINAGCLWRKKRLWTGSVGKDGVPRSAK